MNLDYVSLLREVGSCFSVNNMLRAKCYEQHMEKGRHKESAPGRHVLSPGRFLFLH